MAHPTCNIGIVGGGILGMALAARLTRQGCHVTILEGASRSGGLAAPAAIGAYTWDRFYHVILLSDTHLRGLLDELGLSDRLCWGTTRTGFFTDGALHSLSTSVEFLTFPPLSLIDKARLAATILYASRLKEWKHLEAIPVSDWLRSWSGSRTFERIWLPLLRAKLGENYRIASAAFIWAIIARMYAARRSGMKREMFGYVEGGYAAILDRFEAHLETLGVESRYNSRATEVWSDGEGAEVRLASGEVCRFDRLILTIPCSRIADLCPQLTDAERTRLRSVTYQGIVCAALLLKRPLAGYYITNITESWVPYTAVIETTALVDRRQFGGNSLVYLPRYLAQNDPFWQKSDVEIEREFVAALARMYQGFRADDVLTFQVSRVREMLAVSTLNYSDTVLPPLRTSLEHVFVVNSAQIANGTLNVNETLGLAAAKSAELAPYLRTAATAAA